MSTLKKSAIATITAAALATGICTPAANAAGVKVNGDTCVFTYTEAEQKVTERKTETLDRENSQEFADNLVSEIEEFQQDYANKKISEADYNRDAPYIEYYKTLLPAMRACAAGKDMPASSAEFEAFMSAPNGKELSDAGIGIVAASAVVVVLAGLVAALPQIKPMLPANIQAMLP